MLAIVVFSYRQTIHAYPERRRRLHRGEGEPRRARQPDRRLVAAHRLRPHGRGQHRRRRRRDHVGVSRAGTSIRVELSLGFVVMLMLGNLRGIRESGRIFAVPTYFFIVSILGMIAVGAWRYFTGSLHAGGDVRAAAAARHSRCTLAFVLLTAFSNGCTAMTGVEAVSNGVPAFQPPESRERRADARGHGGDVDHDVRRHHAAGARLRRGAHRGRRPSSRSSRARPSAAAASPYYVVQAGDDG